MAKDRKAKYRIRKTCVRAAAVLLAAILVLLPASAGAAYAAGSGPIREVHKVGVGDKKYCFFVRNIVVMTPSEISEMTDAELVDEVLSRSGLYMKETNCKKSSHKTITPETWEKNGGSFMLSEADIGKIRGASPSDGDSVKLYMDLKISTAPADKDEPDPDTPVTPDEPDPDTPDQPDPNTPDHPDPDDPGDQSGDGQDPDAQGGDGQASGTENTGDEGGGDENGGGAGNGAYAGNGNEQGEQGDTPSEDRPVYSTHKLYSPHLLYVVVVTESDAGGSDDVCGEENPSSQGKGKTKAPRGGGGGGGGEGETLPEYKTIKMEDRSGEPVEPTLEEGTPVTLDWNAPEEENGEDGGSSFFNTFLGKILRMLLLAGILAALAALIIILLKRRREQEEDDEDVEEAEAAAERGDGP